MAVRKHIAITKNTNQEELAEGDCLGLCVKEAKNLIGHKHSCDTC